MKESQILAQAGDYWLARMPAQYVVYRDGLTVARADSAYPLTDDGRSLAEARMKYLAERQEKGLTSPRKCGESTS